MCWIVFLFLWLNLAKRTNYSTKLCATKFVSKPHALKRPPLGNLFHLNNCVKKNVHVPFFARNACLPYRKNGFKAHFFRFAHFFRYGLFYLKLVALPRALQSKRLGTTHFVCGGVIGSLADVQCCSPCWCLWWRCRWGWWCCCPPCWCLTMTHWPHWAPPVQKLVCTKVATATHGKMHQHTNTFLDTSWLFATHGDPLGHLLGV